MDKLFEVYTAHSRLYWLFDNEKIHLCTEQELYEQINEILAKLEYHNGTKETKT